jgi:hypothetical protein
MSGNLHYGVISANGTSGDLRAKLSAVRSVRPAKMTLERVSLDLTRAEAIVLFDWLSRFNDAEQREFVDQAEQRVLWDLEAMLESNLSEPFDPRYAELLAEARAKVRDQAE